MNDVINHKRGDCLWYHTTLESRLPAIKKEGLRINSPPVWQGRPEPWIYVSTEPWPYKLNGELVAILEVDLSFIDQHEAGWPFVEPETKEWEDRWQLRVFRDIPRRYLWRVTT
jgi:hypothetical protein